MSFARIKETFRRLPKQIKFIGIGSLILAVSTFLPWYADLDSYKIGDQFLGVTGPASFVGIVVLILAGFSFGLFVYHLFEKRAPRLPVREAIIHLAIAVESALLLILVNSIYFHPKFGVNITLKESKFGMTVAFAGAIILFVGAYILNKAEIEKTEGEGKLLPLINIEKKPEPQITPPPAPITRRSIAEIHEARKHTPLMQYKAAHQPPPRHEEARSFFFGEKKAQQTEATPPQQPAASEKPATEGNKGKDAGGSYMIRMDL